MLRQLLRLLEQISVAKRVFIRNDKKKIVFSVILNFALFSRLFYQLV